VYILILRLRLRQATPHLKPPLTPTSNLNLNL
jgi:hypothetical protein